MLREREVEKADAQQRIPESIEHTTGSCLLALRQPPFFIEHRPPTPPGLQFGSEILPRNLLHWELGLSQQWIRALFPGPVAHASQSTIG